MLTSSSSFNAVKRDALSEEALRHILGTRIVGYSYASAVAFLIYDILLTLPDEVHFVWPMRLSLTKLAFFFIRYFPPLLSLTTQFYGAPRPHTYSHRGCYIWNVYQALGLLLTVVAVDYILILRIFAMYPRNTFIKVTTAVLYVVEVITVSVGFGLGVPQLHYDERCVAHESPIVLMIAVGLPIVYQAFLFGATVYKFWQSVKAGWGRIPVLQLLVRDGTWAFVVLFAILISEALLYSIDVDAYTGFLYGWANTAFSVCGYRIIINMNKLHRTANQPIVTTSPDIQFTSHFDVVDDHGMMMTSHSEVGVCMNTRDDSEYLDVQGRTAESSRSGSSGFRPP